MNWQDYQIGRRVVCVDNKLEIPAEIELISSLPLPVPGRIYTIKLARPGALYGNLALQLEEFGDNWVEFFLHGKRCRGQLLYEAKYFRPIDESRLDVFRKLLSPTPLVPA